VERFLLDMPAGSVGLDVGCGNGKYLAVNPNIYILGSDRLVNNLIALRMRTLSSSRDGRAELSTRSSNLARIAYSRNVNDSLIADALDLPHPDGRFDFAISIAVIHHFSSSERRVLSIKSILSTLMQQSSDGVSAGRALIYVWALEQKSSRRGWDEDDDQDVFVPWVLSKKYTTQNVNIQTTRTEEGLRSGSTTSNPVTLHRYYHLYRKGELQMDIEAAGGIVLESGYEKDNWWAICSQHE
jgi:tRNA (uracil-5-)-methyltransferase TRM9